MSSNLRTPLHQAANKGHSESVQALLDCGATVNSRDRNDVTPLHLAALHGHEGALATLLEHGASPIAYVC